MATTLAQLIEQIDLLNHGGDQPRQTPFLNEDIALLLKQVVNEKVQAYIMLKLNGGSIVQGTSGSQMETRYQGRDKLINGHFIRTYTNLPVTKLGKMYVLDLDVIPMVLPHERGLLEVYSGQNFEKPFMIIAVSQVSFMLDILKGEIAAAYQNGRIEIYGVCGTLKVVTVKLVTMDVENLGLNDPFSLPAELQAPIVKEVFERLQNAAPRDPINDGEGDIIGKR